MSRKMPFLTSTTLDDARGLREDGLSGAQGLDVVPNFVASVVRVNRGDTRTRVGESLGQTLDAIPVDLNANRNNEVFISNLATRLCGHRVAFRREGLHILLDVREMGGDQCVEGLASLLFPFQTGANEGPLHMDKRSGLHRHGMNRSCDEPCRLPASRRSEMHTLHLLCENVPDSSGTLPHPR